MKPLASGIQHCFNSRPRVGATRSPWSPLLDTVFQFTPPCGGDSAYRSTPGLWMRFNSRPRVGATRMETAVTLNNVFQFTPPCGGDTGLRDKLAKQSVSIHAPVWGRPSRLGASTTIPLFQFTPPCGGDCGFFSISAIFHDLLTDQDWTQYTRLALIQQQQCRNRLEFPRTNPVDSVILWFAKTW